MRDATPEPPAPTPSATTRCAWCDRQLPLGAWTYCSADCKQEAWLHSIVPPASAPAATAGTERRITPPSSLYPEGLWECRCTFHRADDECPICHEKRPAASTPEHVCGKQGFQRGELTSLNDVCPACPRPAAPSGEEAETGCECSMSSSPYPEPNADGSCPLCGKRSRRVAVETLDYPAAARSIALNLAEFCDESLAYPEMIAEAARQAATALAALRARHRECLQFVFDALDNNNDGEALAFVRSEIGRLDALDRLVSKAEGLSTRARAVSDDR